MTGEQHNSEKVPYTLRLEYSEFKRRLLCETKTTLKRVSTLILSLFNAEGLAPEGQESPLDLDFVDWMENHLVIKLNTIISLFDSIPGEILTYLKSDTLEERDNAKSIVKKLKKEDRKVKKETMKDYFEKRMKENKLKWELIQKEFDQENVKELHKITQSKTGLKRIPSVDVLFWKKKQAPEVEELRLLTQDSNSGTGITTTQNPPTKTGSSSRMSKEDLEDIPFEEIEDEEEEGIAQQNSARFRRRAERDGEVIKPKPAVGGLLLKEIRQKMKKLEKAKKTVVEKPEDQTLKSPADSFENDSFLLNHFPNGGFFEASIKSVALPHGNFF